MSDVLLGRSDPYANDAQNTSDVGSRIYEEVGPRENNGKTFSSTAKSCCDGLFLTWKKSGKITGNIEEENVSFFYGYDPVFVSFFLFFVAH